MINMQSSNGTSHTLERRDRIKYLGVMLDEAVSFKYHIAYVSLMISRNNFKIKIYPTLFRLKQIHFSLIYHMPS